MSNSRVTWLIQLSRWISKNFKIVKNLQKKISKNAYKKFFKTFYTSHLSTNTLTLNVHEYTKYNHGSSLGHRTHQKSNYYSFYYALNVFIWVIFDRKRPFHILASLIIVLNFLHKWPFRSENDSK